MWDVKEELTMICFCTFHMSQWAMIWLLMRSHVFRFAAHTQSPFFALWDTSVCTACVCVCCILSTGTNRVTRRGYRALRRTHMFGLREAMKPFLQKHLYEPAVLTQRAFLHGLPWAPGSAHSSMSERNKHKHLLTCSVKCKKGNETSLNIAEYKAPARISQRIYLCWLHGWVQLLGNLASY